jgi:hypothetical protein
MTWLWAIIWGIAGGALPLILVMPMEMPEVGPAIGGSAVGLIMALGHLGGFLYPMVAVGIISSLNPGTALIGMGFLCGIMGYVLAGLLIWCVKETGPKVQEASATK